MRRFFVRNVGHRGSALLFFSLLDFVYAYSLFVPPKEVVGQLSFIQDVAPLSWWGTLWTIVAVICLVNAFRTRDRWGFTAAMLIKVMWGALYVYGGILGVERAYLGAVIWLCLAGWVGIISSWPAPADME